MLHESDVQVLRYFTFYFLYVLSMRTAGGGEKEVCSALLERRRSSFVLDRFNRCACLCEEMT